MFCLSIQTYTVSANNHGPTVGIGSLSSEWEIISVFSFILINTSYENSVVLHQNNMSFLSVLIRTNGLSDNTTEKNKIFYGKLMVI